MRDRRTRRRKTAEVMTTPSGDALPPTSRTVADAVEQHLRMLLQNPMANAGSPQGWTDTLLFALDQLGVLGNLRLGQQQELAELVTKLLAIDETFPVLKPHREQRRRWTKRGRAYLKKLTANTKTASKAVTKLIGCLNKIGVDATGVGALTTALAALDIAALQERLPPLVRAVSDRGESTDDVLVTLHDWFVSQGIPQGEAEYRAATISNEYSDTGFRVTERGERTADGEKKSRGCDAVRRRVRRRFERDTSNKSR